MKGESEALKRAWADEREIDLREKRIRKTDRRAGEQNIRQSERLDDRKNDRLNDTQNSRQNNGQGSQQNNRQSNIQNNIQNNIQSNRQKSRRNSRKSADGKYLICGLAATASVICGSAVWMDGNTERHLVKGAAFAAESAPDLHLMTGSAENTSFHAGGPEENTTVNKAAGDLPLMDEATEDTGDPPASQDESEGESKNESEFESEGESESESESESEYESESDSEPERGSEFESERGSESESELPGEGELEGESGIEFAGEGGLESESESADGSVPEGELKSENELPGEGGLEGEPGSEITGEGETGSENESSDEAVPEGELKSESELPGEGVLEGESGTEFAGEGETGSESESADEAVPEGEPKSENELPGEDVLEGESGTEFADEGEPESELADGNELEGELENKNGSDSETGQESGDGSGNEAALESEGDTENRVLSGNEPGPGGEPGSEEASEAEDEGGIWSEEDSEAENEEGLESGKSSGTGIRDGLPDETASAETEMEKPEKEKPEKVFRGVHYEITGDAGAWYRDRNDRLWVRPGSSLHIRTVKEAGFSDGIRKQNLREDGAILFTLKKAGKDGKILGESAPCEEAYYVDGSVPGAEITVPGSYEDGVAYTAQSGSAALYVPPDEKSGLKKIAYALVPCERGGSLKISPESVSWKTCENGSSVPISEEGFFRIYARTEDQVGNLAFSESSLVCVDRTPPAVVIEGVGDQTANSGKIRIRVAAEDTCFRKGSLQVEIAGLNGGKLLTADRREENGMGASAEYFDIPRLREYDDVYQMSVRAEDLAGNVTERLLEFSVNRFGSVYDLNRETKQNLEQYFLTEAGDIVFYETNIDYVGESKIFCRRDGVLSELERGRDYQVRMQGNRDSWKQYQYTIPAEYFAKEGIYELLLSSGDRADNKSDTGIQEKQVAFVLDRSAPDCILTGIEERIYRADGVTAYLTAHDNAGLQTVRVYHNSELLLEKKLSGDTQKKIELPLNPAEEWQTLQVYLCDLAGNEYWSEEVPVYISERSKKVAEYQKIRASARERLEQSADLQGSPDIRDTVQLTVRPAGQAGSSREENRTFSDAEAMLTGRRTEGSALLILGAAVFVITFSACILTGIRRKN